MWFSVQTAAIPLLLSIVSLTLDFYTLKSEGNQTEYTELEEKLLGQIRLLAKDDLTLEYERRDEFLIRWIRDCKLDVNCAYEKLLAMKQWKKVNEMDSILNETVAEVRAFPEKSCSMDTFDNEGYPVLICEADGVDVRRLILAGQREYVRRYYLQWVERLLLETGEVTQKKGRFIKYPIFIINGHGYNIRQHGCYACVDLAREYVRISGLYYPQMLEYLIFVNVPKIALPLVQILKPVFSEYYQNSIKIFGTDKEESSKFLLSKIPANQLAIKYGGTNPK